MSGSREVHARFVLIAGTGEVSRQGGFHCSAAYYEVCNACFETPFIFIMAHIGREL